MKDRLKQLSLNEWIDFYRDLGCRLKKSESYKYDKKFIDFLICMSQFKDQAMKFWNAGDIFSCQIPISLLNKSGCQHHFHPENDVDIRNIDPLIPVNPCILRLTEKSDTNLRKATELAVALQAGALDIQPGEFIVLKGEIFFYSCVKDSNSRKKGVRICSSKNVPTGKMLHFSANKILL